MMGRAALDDPSLFFDVDRAFYGEAANPTRNRRQVLERYCQYLERTYPRRCCDDDGRVTFEYPAPDVAPSEDGGGGGYCHICEGVYSSSSGGVGGGGAAIRRGRGTEGGLKIAARIVARSLKPVQGIFNGVPRSRAFRRTCDRLGRDPSVRNCGPGFILRKAMEAIPASVLDQDFVSEEY